MLSPETSTSPGVMTLPAATSSKRAACRTTALDPDAEVGAAFCAHASDAPLRRRTAAVSRFIVQEGYCTGERRRRGCGLLGWCGLPELDAVAFGIGDPAEFAEVVAVAFRIDCDAGRGEAVEHGIEVLHLNVEHGFLFGWEVGA